MIRAWFYWTRTVSEKCSCGECAIQKMRYDTVEVKDSRISQRFPVQNSQSQLGLVEAGTAQAYEDVCGALYPSPRRNWKECGRPCGQAESQRRSQVRSSGEEPGFGLRSSIDEALG